MVKQKNNLDPETQDQKDYLGNELFGILQQIKKNEIEPLPEAIMEDASPIKARNPSNSQLKGTKFSSSTRNIKEQTTNNEKNSAR